MWDKPVILNGIKTGTLRQVKVNEYKSIHCIFFPLRPKHCMTPNTWNIKKLSTQYLAHIVLMDLYDHFQDVYDLRLPIKFNFLWLGS